MTKSNKKFANLALTAQEIGKRIDEEKAQLDTETRRKVRAFWAPVGFVLGFAAAYLIQWLF